MYKRILVPLENSSYDVIILEHIRQLAKLCKSSLVLVHVADGFAARNVKSLSLRASDEIRNDRSYLDECTAALSNEGFEVEALLAGGDPAREITAAAEREGCDLIAMAVHGHRGIQDVIFGTTANTVRHQTLIPVLMVRAPHPTA